MLKEFTVFDIFQKLIFLLHLHTLFTYFFLSNHFCIQKNLFRVKHSSTLVIGKHHQLFPPFTMDMQSLVIGSKFVLLPPTWYSEWIHEGGDTVNFRGITAHPKLMIDCKQTDKRTNRHKHQQQIIATVGIFFSDIVFCLQMMMKCMKRVSWFVFWSFKPIYKIIRQTNSFF